MKKNDIILIIVVLLLGVVSYGLLKVMNKQDGNALRVVIKHKGQVVKTYYFDQTTNENYIMDEDGAYNIVQIANGTVVMSESNCHDLICVKTGAISQPGDIIVCLPHKFTVEIVSSENLSELDDIAE